MSMFKKLTSAFIVSSTLLSPLAMAEKQGATVTFEATVRNASCVVSSTTEGAMVNWGVFTTQELEGVNAGTAIGDEKEFYLTLTECSADTQADDAVVSVYASGATSAFDPTLFANSASKSMAVKLQAVDADNNGVLLTPNKYQDVKLSHKLAENGFANIPMKASLIMVNKALTGDSLKVPVTFTVAYN